MWKLIERLEPTSDAEANDSVTLPFELRMRGRLKATSDNGRELGLFLNRGPVLRDGALLRAESGEVVEVHAADESVVTARVPAGVELARLCYHLGNRHVQLAIGGDVEEGWVRFPPDHVLEALARRLGAILVHHEAPFDPEPGAYTDGHGHHHSHGHDDVEGDSHGHGKSGAHAQVYDFQHHHSHRHDHNHEH